MSYTSLVKEFLSKKKTELCCKKAELYGFLLFTGKFSRDGAVIVSENDFIIKRCEETFKLIKFSGYKKTEKIKQKKRIKLELDSEGVSDLVRKIGDFNIKPPLKIDFSAFDNECCYSAFLRGAFLASGFISAPDLPYHLEIKTSHAILAENFVRLCEEINIKIRNSSRNGIRVLYIKSSEQIKDFLTFIGGAKFVFDFANAELEKNLKNNVNRAVNCEQANIEKSVTAAQNQIKAIKKLKETNYKGISKDLIYLAELRLENPEMTLEELGKAMTPQLSKSGVAHRMKKIQELGKNE